MTDQQKEKITDLREQGYGYKRIAKEVNLSVSTVRYICSLPKKENSISGICLNCGIETMSIPHKKAKKFCSDRCRWEWHNKTRQGKSHGTKEN